MSPRPKAIDHSIGNRIRVVLGATGESYLLILNEDDGDRTWQSVYWSGGDWSDGLKTQINNCRAKGRQVTAVAFGPDNEWWVSGAKPDGTVMPGGEERMRMTRSRRSLQNVVFT